MQHIAITLSIPVEQEHLQNFNVSNADFYTLFPLLKDCNSLRINIVEPRWFYLYNSNLQYYSQ